MPPEQGAGAVGIGAVEVGLGEHVADSMGAGDHREQRDRIERSHHPRQDPADPGGGSAEAGIARRRGRRMAGPAAGASHGSFGFGFGARDISRV